MVVGRAFAPRRIPSGSRCFSQHAPPRRLGLTALTSLARDGPSCARLPNRGVLALSGPHAPHFLDGLISAKVPDPSSRSHLYSVFLNAKGRVLYDAFIHSNATSTGDPGYLIEYDPRPSEALPLIGMLKRHVLRSKVKIRNVSDEFEVWATWNPEQMSYGIEAEKERQWNFSQTGVIEPVWDPQGIPSPWGVQGDAIRDRRAVALGHRMLARKGHKPQEMAAFDEASLDDYIFHRYVNGVPEGADDLSPTTALPINSNLDIMGALSFRKGCHVGQELIVRSMHVNVLRKRLLPAIIHRPDQTPDEAASTPVPSFPPNVDISCKFVTEDPEKPRPRSKSPLVNNLRGVGLAMLNLEQVEAWERGECGFEFEYTDGKEPSSSARWIVSPSMPLWWPKPEIH